MQSFETPETIVHDFDAKPTPTDESQGQWSGDRPIYLTLAVSALASVAAVPVILAAYGPMETMKLIYPAILAGLLVGASGLLVAGLAVSIRQAVKSMRSGQAAPKTKPSGRLRGKLALG